MTGCAKIVALPQNSTTYRDFSAIPRGRYGTALVDPPWRFDNRTGKVAPEHRRLARYETMSLDEICGLQVADIVAPTAHLYLWVP